MKTKILAAMALISTSFTPVSMMTTAAHAINPTTADMQLVCDGLYVNSHEDPSKWRTTVTNADFENGPSTQVEGSERNINYRPDVTSSFVYANFLRAEDPLTRTGGSVNMWGQSVFGSKIWDNTLYDVEADFYHTVTFTWTCHVQELVTTTTGNPGQGSGNPGLGDCIGNPSDGEIDGEGPGQGASHANENSACGTGSTTETWTDRGDYSDNSAQGDDIAEAPQIIETALQQLGHVDGVNYTESGTYRPEGVRTLACINPGKKGGSWTPKNNYAGSNCNTTYFNTAMTAYGYDFGGGTGVLPSASLPSLP